MESRVEALTWPRANRNAAALPPNPAARGLREDGSWQACPPSSPKHVVDSGASTRQQSEGSVSSGVRKCTRGRRRRSTPPLASVPPSSRPKLAAGTSNQHRQVIQDIDVLDVDNQLGVADYIEDIYKFYKVAEYELVPIKPSMVVAAVYAARLTLKKTLYGLEALQHQTGFCWIRTNDCVKIMVTVTLDRLKERVEGGVSEVFQ
ncbi:hypothetical protein ZWY2020_005494 [Hordeum vulgare]|nr:hypothetical protein ZWY2020_005494 [Hordeum vulgare]